MKMLICFWNKSIYLSLKVSSASVVTNKLLLGLFTGVLFRFFFNLLFFHLAQKRWREELEKVWSDQILKRKDDCPQHSNCPIPTDYTEHALSFYRCAKHK